MHHQVVPRLPGLAEQVVQARHFVAALVAEKGPVDDATLVVSELARPPTPYVTR
ncbi:non-specific serine/threonine protein kinase OS=Streptomyces albaduncus OX=68172 GN=FHS32_003821 PE=3 SV=1 [Streptomyces griseoloalbus]